MNSMFRKVLGGGEAILNSMADYVVSYQVKTDTSDQYYMHRKWNSGLWEYIKYYKGVNADCTTVYGSSYYCDKKGWWFPPMKNVYVINMSHTSGNGGSWFNINSYDTTNETFEFRIFNPVSNTRAIDVTLYVLGSWK